jgi:hypothetical protein
MSLNRTAWLTTFDSVSTTLDEDLGALREYKHPTFGWGIYRYVWIKGAGVTAGLLVQQEYGTDKFECVLGGAVAPKRIMGVCITAIPSGSYGWVLAQGYATFVSDGGTTANTAQTPAANGQCTDVAAATNSAIVFANATENPAGAGGTFQGFIRAV